MLLSVRKPCLLLVGFCHCTTGGTCELHGADYGVLRVHQFETLEVEVADCERFAETESVYVDNKTLGDLAVDSFHFDLAH